MLRPYVAVRTRRCPAVHDALDETPLEPHPSGMITTVYVMLPLLSLVHAAQPAIATEWKPGPGTSGVVYQTSGAGNGMDQAGARLTIRSDSAPSTAYGTIATQVPADGFVSRRVRLIADVATSDVTGGASAWIRVDGPNGVLAIENAMDRLVRGTASGRFESVLYVPANATKIAFGLLLQGQGSASATGLRIEALAAARADAPVTGLAREVLERAWTIVRSNSLWRDTITWAEVEPEYRAIAAGASKPEEVYPAIRFLLKRLGDNHSFFMQPSGAQSFVTGGAQNPQPQVRLLQPGIGYVSVPTYSGSEPTAMRAFAARLQDSLAAIAPQAPCNWVVDLRTNQGGNMWPMLGGLRPLLGDGGLGSFATNSGAGPQWRAGARVDVRPSAALAALDSANVAVLIGAQTASSGEAVAISFIGRPRTRTFGQPSAGYSTANQNFTLPDRSMMFVTVSVQADRNGTRYGHAIAPDETVPASARDARDDVVLTRAIAWLRSQPSCNQSRLPTR